MLTDEMLASWAKAAMTHYESGGQNTPDVASLRRRDVELAGDVASLMPVLYLFARWIRIGQQPQFVEIGTSDGSSALPLAKAAHETGGHLHSVDPAGCEDAHRRPALPAASDAGKRGKQLRGAGRRARRLTTD